MQKAFQVPTLVVLTGAARGIGQATAVACSKQIQDNKQCQGSCIILLDMLDLSSTRDQIRAISDVTVLLVNSDLSDTDHFDELTCKLLQGIEPGAFRQAILINNAATMLYKSAWRVEAAEIEKYVRLNVSSMVALSAWFVRTFRTTDRQVLVVNLTSVAARTAFHGMAAYAVGKAPRETFIRDLVHDNLQGGVWAFSFGPGVVDTAMTQWIATSPHSHPDLVKRMEERRAQGEILQPEHVAAKMVSTIAQGGYQNGDRVYCLEL